MIPGFSPRDKAVFSHTKFRLSTRGGEIVEKLAQLGFILARRGRVGLAWRRRQAAVPGDRGADRDLARVLSALGWQVEGRWRPGLPAFFAAGGGFRLIAQDETGTPIPPDRLLALVSLIEMENGGGVIALPACRAAGAALAAAGCGGQVLTLERDGERARRLYAARPWLWSAPAAAGRICARMAASGERLSTLAGLVGEGSGG